MGVDGSFAKLSLSAAWRCVEQEGRHRAALCRITAASGPTLLRLIDVTPPRDEKASSFQVAEASPFQAVAAVLHPAVRQRTHQLTADTQSRRPSPAGTRQLPIPDTHGPNPPASSPCTSAAPLRGPRESRCGVAQTIRWQILTYCPEACPDCPRTDVHCPQAQRNSAQASCAARLRKLCYAVHAFLLHCPVTKMLGESRAHLRIDSRVSKSHPLGATRSNSFIEFLQRGHDMPRYALRSSAIALPTLVLWEHPLWCCGNPRPGLPRGRDGGFVAP